MKYRYMYLYLSLNNGVCHTELAKTLETEHYLCAVSELSGKITNSNFRKVDRLFLCSDVCQESFVDNTKLPILCEIHRNQNGVVTNTFQHMNWLHVLRPNLSCVKLYILDDQGVDVSVDFGSLRCTLMFAFDSSYKKRK